MYTLKSYNLIEEARGLLQATALQIPVGLVGPVQSSDQTADGYIRASGEAMQTLFTRTFAATLTGEVYYEIGKGVVDPLSYTRLLLQYAIDNGIPFSAVRQEYDELVQATALDNRFWTELTAYVVGTNKNSVRDQNVAVMTVTTILEMVRRMTGSSANDLLNYLIADYVGSLIAKVGKLLPDAGFVYKASRIDTYPTYEDMINVVEASSLMHSISALTEADVSQIRGLLTAKQAFNPMLLTKVLSSSMAEAHERNRDRYDAKTIVDSVLLNVGRALAPNTPQDLQPKEYVTKNPSMQELRSNLAVFMAYQEMIGTDPGAISTYDEMQLVAIALPRFMEAMAEVSPFKVRPLLDTVGFYGKTDVVDYTGAPVTVVLYENWDVPNGVAAFTPIRHLSSGSTHFLKSEQEISQRMSTSLKAINTALSVQRFVNERLHSAELIPETSRVTQGCEIVLAMPSMTERELEWGLDKDFIMTVMRDGVESAVEGSSASEDDKPALRRTAKRVAHNYYAALVHYATSASGSSVSIGQLEVDQANPRIYLMWRAETRLKLPLGQSPIYAGEVFCTEPLEAIAYSPNRAPPSSLKANVIDLDPFSKSLHIWDWYNRSAGLLFRTSYATTISGHSASINVAEHEILGLGATREKVRFLVPPATRALVRMWLDWLFDEYEFVTEQASAQEGHLRTAFEGRIIGVALSLVNRLSSVGGSLLGATATRVVMQRLIASLTNAHKFDEASTLTRGIQQSRLRLWSGLVTLQLLGLIDEAEAEKLLKIIRDTNVLSLVVATTLDSVN